MLGRMRDLCLLAIVALLAGGRATAASLEARHLRCTLPAGASFGVIHRDGVPLALTLGVEAGTRDCGSRSTQEVQPDGTGWRFTWDDAVLGQRFDARVQALPGGGYALRFTGAEGREAMLACGALALPSSAELRLGGAGCTDKRDRSEALQAAWSLLRPALLQRDADRLRQVLAPQVQLAEGAEADSPYVSAARLAPHVACLAGLGGDAHGLARWAQVREHLPTALTDVRWKGDEEVQLGDFAALRWLQGRWQLDWVNASRATLLRECPAKASR